METSSSDSEFQCEPTIKCTSASIRHQRFLNAPTVKGESVRFTECEWVEDQDNAITNDALEQHFGPLSEELVDDVLEKREQVHAALLALTESESFDIFLGAAPPGLEALRRSFRRWELLSGWRNAQSALATNPGSRSVQEKWEELVRRYEGSTSRGTTTAALEEDTQTAAIEALVPSELPCTVRD